MLKARPLCSGAESYLIDRFLGEVEKNSFIALPGKGGHSGPVSFKTLCPNLGGFGEELYRNGSRVELLIRLGCVHSFNLTLHDLLMNFSGSFNLVSDGLLWNEEC